MELVRRIQNGSIGEKKHMKNLFDKEEMQVKKGEAMCKNCNKRNGRKLVAELALLLLLPLLLACKQLSSVQCLSYPNIAESAPADKGESTGACV